MDRNKLEKAIQLEKVISKNEKGLYLIDYWIQEGKKAKKVSISFSEGTAPVELTLNIDSFLNHIKLATKEELDKIQKEFESM